MSFSQIMVERAEAKRALERLVVNKNKFKGKSSKKGMNGTEMMKMLLDESQIAASCYAGKTAGLEQEVLDSIMDRTNVDHFREKMKLVNGKTAEQMLKDMEAEEIEAERIERERREAKKRRKSKAKGKQPKDLRCPSCSKVFMYKKKFREHVALEKCKGGWKPYKCKYCGQRFKDTSEVLDHIKVRHPEQEGYVFPQTFSGDMFLPRKCCVKVAKLTGPLEFPKKKYFSRKVGRYVLEVISDSEPEEVEMDLGKKVSKLREVELPEVEKSSCESATESRDLKDRGHRGALNAYFIFMGVFLLFLGHIYVHVLKLQMIFITSRQ